MNRAGPDSLRVVFADNVRRRRAELGWSQEMLAAEAKLHRTYVGSIERAERNVSLDNIAKLAAALNLAPDLLLR